MALLNAADALFLGAQAVDRAYLGAVQVWPQGAPVQYAAARFQDNTAFARSPSIAIGGANPNGCTNFEIQALVLIEGARTGEDRVFMVQFPASRQCGLFCANTSPFELRTGDSQAGSVGGAIGANPVEGEWCFLTFSADGTPGTSGFYRGTIESLDGSTVPFSAGGRTKGVEVSLQGNRADLNGGGVDNGFPAGIRYAHVRAYPAQRSDAQRQADKTRATPEGTELFWWDFQNDGGVLTAVDLTGNGILPVLTNATLAAGPEF